jgi:hypothetical protein
MTTNYHVPIAFAAPADSAIINTPLGTLDAELTSQAAAITNLQGGASVASDTLKAWTESGAYQLTALTRDSDGVVTTAAGFWPDGSAGEFVTVTKNATWLAIDAYTVDHKASGKVVTQAAVTRDSDGGITVKPALTIT